MTAALELADQGFQVHLVEKTGTLGGNLHRVRFLEANPAFRVAAAASPSGTIPAYSAAALAAWLDPGPRRLVDLAAANDAFGRWCEPLSPPRRRLSLSRDV